MFENHHRKKQKTKKKIQKLKSCDCSFTILSCFNSVFVANGASFVFNEIGNFRFVDNFFCFNFLSSISFVNLSYSVLVKYFPSVSFNLTLQTVFLTKSLTSGIFFSTLVLRAALYQLDYFQLL